jgi:hypothetical protein
MSLAENQHVVKLPVTPKSTPPCPREVAQRWISNFEDVLSQNDASRLGDLFHKESWWRDTLALDWDFRSVQNLDQIQAYVQKNQPQAQLSGFRLQDQGKYQPTLESPIESLTWVASMFFFETKVGKGTGMLRLTQAEDGTWKAYVVYTSLQELKGSEEPLDAKRAPGTKESMPGGFSGGNWYERRQRQLEFLDEEPTVLVVGAGMVA